MPKITIDGKEVECRPGISVLQAALEIGRDIPHYCYHPGLRVVASCRLCLMEMKMPHPQTGELDWAPKLMPSCQTPVKDGIVVRFDSDKVRANVERTMEDILLNHPLDCPVCDQAGECYLQDYSFKFGAPTSRMVEQKQVNPKKDIGPRTLLYSDRCVLCSRCVRFTEEITGTHELCVVNRGSRAEIDVFPGLPLDNPLQGNVVDICPVGALLDKDFLFQQRVWFLSGAPSICPGCSTGCAIRVDSHDGVVHRLKPRYNPGVNDWWMCDEGRYGYQHVNDERRITRPRRRRGAETSTPTWDELPTILRYRLADIARECGPDQVAAVLSPMMACEEAWLLGRFIRDVAPEASLVLGHVPCQGEDRSFPTGADAESARFVIRAEKCPNRRGIELLLESFGGNTPSAEEFLKGVGEGAFDAVWMVGGYPVDWVSKEWKALAGKVPFLVVQDLFDNALTEAAEVVLPMCAFSEREGSFMNAGGKLQPFARATNPPTGCRRDGQYLYEIGGYEGLYNAGRVRAMMADGIPAFAEVADAPPRPVHQH